MIPKGFAKGFGPGLLWAAAAIGVSHLVQSTRAGAVAGFALTGVIVLALVLKYPFFEFGPRYAAATGRSLVEGYKAIGKWALWLFFVLTAVSSVIVAAAIVSFTAALLNNLLQVQWSLPVSSAVVLAVCAGLLLVGRYKVLDRAIKLILVALGISTLIAAAVSLPRADVSTISILPDLNVVPFAFLLALAGWMPSALDISVWNSLWTLAKDTDEGERASVETALLDFNIGYFGTAILAFAFLLLGATVMYGSGQQFSNAGAAFSMQLVNLYSETLGAWLRPIVLVAVFATMFSTALTVLDGYPRALDRCVQNLSSDRELGRDVPVGRTYWVAIFILAVTTIVILSQFLGSMTQMVDFATIFTFLTAPILGWLNLRVVTSDAVPAEHKPGPKLIYLSYVGIALLGGTAVVYIIQLF